MVTVSPLVSGSVTVNVPSSTRSAVSDSANVSHSRTRAPKKSYASSQPSALTICSCTVRHTAAPSGRPEAPAPSVSVTPEDVSASSVTVSSRPSASVICACALKSVRSRISCRNSSLTFIMLSDPPFFLIKASL